MAEQAVAVVGRLTVVVVVVLAGLVTTGSVASAADPVVTVSPAVVRSGDTFQVEATGFGPFADEGIYGSVAVCPADVPSSPTVGDLWARCVLFGAEEGYLPVPASYEARESYVPSAGYGGDARVSCRPPTGCRVAVVAIGANSGSILQYASAPLVVEPPAVAVTVTPAVVPVSGSVTVDVAGLPSGPGAVAVCDVGWSSPWPLTLDEIQRVCTTLATYPTGVPPSVDLQIPYVITAGTRTLHCGEGDRCELLVYAQGSGGTLAGHGRAMLEFVAVAVSAVPGRNLTDGQAVTVRATGLPPGPATVLQCGADPRTDGDGSCGPATPATIADDGALVADITVHAGFVDRRGSTRTCGYDCLIAVVPADEARLVVTGGGFGPPALERRETGVGDPGTWTVVDVRGFPGASMTSAWCALPLGATYAASQCAPARPTAPLDRNGNGVTSAPIEATAGSTDVDCRDHSCGVGGFDSSGRAITAVPVPLRGRTVMTVEPSTGLLAGRTVTVRATNLVPNRGYWLQQCVSVWGVPSCQPAEGWYGWPDADGNLVAEHTVEALVSVNGRRHLCRDQCVIVLTEAGAGRVGSVPIALADGSVSASPSSGLSDGQTVTVSGTGIQPTYAGPRVWFDTGGWTLVQCDAAVGATPTLLDTFTHCATPAGGGAVAVPGSTFQRDVAVEANLTTFLGGTTDCTTAAGACVIGVARWEADLTVSAAFTPLSFG